MTINLRRPVLSRMRGRIALLRTERQRLLERGKIACRFDELTANTTRNCYVRTGLEVIAKVVRDQELAHRCRSLATRLRRMGVVGACPSRSEVSIFRFGRHDAHDREMLEAARLAFDLALPTETAGMQHLPLPDREGLWIRKLFEKGIAGVLRCRTFRGRVACSRRQHTELAHRKQERRHRQNPPHHANRHYAGPPEHGTPHCHRHQIHRHSLARPISKRKSEKRIYLSDLRLPKVSGRQRRPARGESHRPAPSPCSGSHDARIRRDSGPRNSIRHR